MRMEGISLSWSVESNGGKKKAPEWRDIESLLNSLSMSYGVVQVEFTDDFSRLNSLQVRAEKGKYLLTLGRETEDDWIVMNHSNPSPVSQVVEILGDSWDGGFVSGNFGIVVEAFRQFFENGRVDESIIS